MLTQEMLYGKDMMPMDRDRVVKSLIDLILQKM